jgi:hypothetical protein
MFVRIKFLRIFRTGVLREELLHCGANELRK